MQMMKCPTCGAANSIKREKCFECDADLHALAAAAHGQETVRVCKNCIHSTVFPPPGTTIGYTDVWCLRRELVRNADAWAEECFEISFTWKREESLD
ncbi:MAG: hypothetical protein JSV65_04605 [Armatimonadota bacterium]|nr:MAG: hypothetical protein JSV65_04605 [Armatimonadota bacterium]